MKPQKKQSKHGTHAQRANDMISLIEIYTIIESMDEQVIEIMDDPAMFEIAQDFSYIALAMTTGNICPCLTLAGEIKHSGTEGNSND